MGETKDFSRRNFLKLVSFCGVSAIFAALPTAAIGAEPLSAKELELTLYPKTEAEKKFLAEVAQQVKQKKIPQKTAYSAWKYAMKKQKTVRCRYFGETLALLCRRSGKPLTLKVPKD